MNLEAVVYWATEEPFIDRVHTAQPWIAKDASGNDISSTLTRDQNGDFTNLTGVSQLRLAAAVDPKGASTVDEYVLTYTGTAKVSVIGCTIVSQTPGKVVFDLTGADTKSTVDIAFTNLDPANPVSDPHLVRVDQQDLFNAGEIFNPDFVAKVSQWGMVRFMDWGNTNTSGAVDWSTRDTLDNSFWSKQAHADGVPIEAMVQLANEAHVDMWYNVPTKADDTYVRNALTYIRDHLDPSLKVHVEWSNEVWNTGFSANAYAKSQATALWGSSVSSSHAAGVYYGYRSAQIAEIANEVFTGSHSAQLRDVLAGQQGSATTDWIAGAAKAGYTGPISGLFDEYAVAPYFGQEMGTAVASADLQTIVGWAKGGAAGLDAAFHELEFGGTLSADYSLAHAMANIAKSGQIAAANGLEFVTYEGGTSLSTTRWATADKAAVQDLFNRMFADPRMGDLYAKEIAAFKAAGGTLFTNFNDVGTPGDSGSWGSLSSIYSDSTPRYDALLAAGGKTGTAVAGTDSSALNDGHSGSGGTGSGTGSTGTSEAPATSGHILGTSSDDYLVASAQNDTVDGASGNDHIVGSSSTTDALGHLIEADVYTGGAGADTVDGGDGNDHIYGNEVTTVAGAVDGADSLNGGGGMDYLQGNAGSDTIDGGAGNDRVYGGADNDSLNGGDGNDYVQGNRGNDILSGGNGNDVVHGGADDDMVRGNAGNDQLFGDAGNDSLVGGTGIDVMTGGAGSDTFVFNGRDAAFTTTGASAWAMDEITDFTHGSDKFEFDFHPAHVFTGSASSAAAALTLANSLVGAHPGEADVAAVTVGNDTYLFWDAAGQGGVIDSAVKIDHVHDSFTLADFA
jgi:Ca2+-binding RTX toxin-like protein